MDDPLVRLAFSSVLGVMIAIPLCTLLVLVLGLVH